MDYIKQHQAVAIDHNSGVRIEMTKKELVVRVSEKLDGVSQKAAAKAIDAVFESIAEGLQQDGVVSVGKWGTYTSDAIVAD
jgi:nucleoid DNA-binding protein